MGIPVTRLMVLVTDSYPNRARIASIRILSGVDVKVVARVLHSNMIMTLGVIYIQGGVVMVK